MNGWRCLSCPRSWLVGEATTPADLVRHISRAPGVGEYYSPGIYHRTATRETLCGPVETRVKELHP